MDLTHQKQVIAIFLLFLISRICVVWTVPDIHVTSDSQEYITLANTIKETGTITQFDRPETYRTPGYPSFLASCFTIFGSESFRLVASVQALLYALQAVLIFCMIKHLTSQKYALYSLLLLLLNAGSIISVISMLTETLFSTFLVFTVWIWVCMWDQKPILKYFATGFCIGFLTLIRPITQFLWLPVLILIIWQKTNWKERVHCVLPFLVGLMLTQGIWVLRNYNHYGSIYVSEISTALFYIPWGQALKAERTGTLVDELYEKAWQEWDADREKLSPTEMCEKYNPKFWEEFQQSYMHIPELFIKGAARQVYDSGWMPLIAMYNPMLPLTVSELRNAVLSFQPTQQITAVFIIAIRLIELLMNVALYGYFFGMNQVNFIRNRKSFSNDILFIILILLYLFFLSSGPFSNFRFREQYFSLLCIASFLFLFSIKTKNREVDTI